jgi:hypothetical protein
MGQVLDDALDVEARLGCGGVTPVELPDQGLAVEASIGVTGAIVGFIPVSLS